MAKVQRVPNTLNRLPLTLCPLTLWGLLFCLALPSLALAQQSEETNICLIRHFEKAKGRNPALTEEGQKRAKALAHYFSQRSLQSVYSTNYKRTQQTAFHVAQSQSLPIVSYDPTNLSDFALQIKGSSNILVVGHSNTTPELIGLLGGKVKPIAENEYGTLYCLQLKSDSTQVTTTKVGNN